MQTKPTKGQILGEELRQIHQTRTRLIQRLGAAQVDVRLAGIPRVGDVLAEAVAEIERLREILIKPAALRIHVERHFPEYAWENREYIARLRSMAEELERQQLFAPNDGPHRNKPA